MSAATIKSMSEAERELLAGFDVSALRIKVALARHERRVVRQALGMIAGAPELVDGEGERAALAEDQDKAHDQDPRAAWYAYGTFAAGAGAEIKVAFSERS